MNKKTMVVALVVSAAAFVQADYLLNIKAGYGFSSDYANDPSGATPLLLNAGDQARVEFYYAGANGQIDFDQVNPGNATSGTDYLLNHVGATGDDVLIGSWLTDANTQDGATEYAPFNFDVQEAYLGETVFARVYDVGAQNGDGFFFQSATFTAHDLTPPAAPEAFQVDNDPNPAFAGLQANGDVYAVIPEPATFGLMGVAGLGLFLARKKARR